MWKFTTSNIFLLNNVFNVNEVPLFWNGDSVFIVSGNVTSLVTNQSTTNSNSSVLAFCNITESTEILNKILQNDTNLSPNLAPGEFTNIGCIISLTPSPSPSILTEYREKIQKYILKNYSVEITITNIQLSTDYSTYTILSI